MELKKTCGKCAHAVRKHYYRPDFLYCEVRKSGRTAFGLKRIRSRMEACVFFELPSPPQAKEE